MRPPEVLRVYPWALDEIEHLFERMERLEGVDVDGKVIGAQAHRSDPCGIFAFFEQRLIRLVSDRFPQAACPHDRRVRYAGRIDLLTEFAYGGLERFAQKTCFKFAQKDLGLVAIGVNVSEGPKFFLGEVIRRVAGITEGEDVLFEGFEVDRRKVKGAKCHMIVVDGFAALFFEGAVQSTRCGGDGDIVVPEVVEKTLDIHIGVLPCALTTSARLCALVGLCRARGGCCGSTIKQPEVCRAISLNCKVLGKARFAEHRGSIATNKHRTACFNGSLLRGCEAA
jgi:hypothetical protein